MGLSTYEVPLTLFSTNRSKLCSHSSSLPPNSLIYIKGGTSTTRNDTDHEPIFHQESYFHYLFGVKEPDCAGLIEAHTGKTTLLVPNYPKEYEWWMGRIKTKEEWKRLYQVDDVRYMEDMEDVLLEIMNVKAGEVNNEEDKEEEEDKKEKDETNNITVLLLSGPNSDSGNVYSPPTETFTPFLSSHTTKHSSSLSKIIIDTTTLHPILSECRVLKSPHERSLLRHVTELTSLSHVYTMKHIKPSMMEYQGESLFRHYAYFTGGARHVGYTPICGCGPNASVLHYGHAAAPNDVQIQDGDMCLFDMGVEYYGYGSDVTCSFPANGVFTMQQRVIYEGVLNAQRVVYDMCGDGTSWVDCHQAAEGEILKALITAGIVLLPDDQTVEELVEMRLGAVFMPHGLGHFIGIDTHDVGGYLPGHPERITKAGLKSLRTARVLRAGMTITVEPGCYFIPSLIEEATSPSSPFCQYLNKDVLKEYVSFGGARLEDVVEITQDGCINYTICPRTIKEVEHVMRGGKWPPLCDEMPELKRVNLLTYSPLVMNPPSI